MGVLRAAAQIVAALALVAGAAGATRRPPVFPVYLLGKPHMFSFRRFGAAAMQQRASTGGEQQLLVGFLPAAGV